MASEVNIGEMRVVVMEDEDDLFRISFCDDPAKPSHYILMEQAKEYSAQDRQMGMDSFYIEVDGQQNCQYGGVDRIRLTDPKFTINFTLNSNLDKSLHILKFTTDPAKAAEAADFIERHFQIPVDRK